jgi:dephospho-CoA kinase
MSRPTIIGITGKKFSGKDTLGKLFINYGYRKIAFADALKDTVKNIFDFTEEQVNGTQKEIVDEYWKKTPRQIMQFIGTDMFRNHMSELIPEIDKNIWCYVVKRKIENAQQKNKNSLFVITDVRFPNEAEIIKNMGGVIIKITRDNIENSDVHESENSINLINYNYVFENNGSIEDLYKKVYEKLQMKYESD